jgi:hypothetical protein
MVIASMVRPSWSKTPSVAPIQNTMVTGHAAAANRGAAPGSASRSNRSRRPESDEHDVAEHHRQQTQRERAQQRLDLHLDRAAGPRRP